VLVRDFACCSSRHLLRLDQVAAHLSIVPGSSLASSPVAIAPRPSPFLLKTFLGYPRSVAELLLARVLRYRCLPNKLLSADTNQLLRNAKTICLSSDTAFLTVETMQRALLKQKDWSELDLKIVGDPKLADLLLHVDRLVFTHIHTYVLTDKKTSIVLASGRKTSFDGITASPDIANQVVKILMDARRTQVPKKQ
jgi:hypothetical protein